MDSSKNIVLSNLPISMTILDLANILIKNGVVGLDDFKWDRLRNSATLFFSTIEVAKAAKGILDSIQFQGENNALVPLQSHYSISSPSIISALGTPDLPSHSMSDNQNSESPLSMQRERSGKSKLVMVDPIYQMWLEKKKQEKVEQEQRKKDQQAIAMALDRISNLEAKLQGNSNIDMNKFYKELTDLKAKVDTDDEEIVVIKQNQQSLDKIFSDHISEYNAREKEREDAEKLKQEKKINETGGYGK